MQEILNVLIVEDEKPIRDDLISFPWDEYGTFVVGEASNGRDALDYFDELVPDIVVTDISMPVMDGLALMKEAAERHPDTAFIILTCHADFDYARSALKLGAVDYIMKAGMEDEDLAKAIRKARQQIRSVKGFRQSEWREELWRLTAEVQEFSKNETQLPAWIPIPSYLEAVQMVSIRRDATFVNRFSRQFLEATGEKGWFSPGTNRLAHFTDSSDIESTRGMVLDMIAAAETELPYLAGEIRFFGTKSAVISGEADIRNAIAQLELWRENAFYQGDRVVFSGIPESLPDLNDLQRDELDSMYRSVERSVVQLIDFLREDLYSWAVQNPVKPDQLKSMVLSWRESWKRRHLSGSTNERFWVQVTGVSNVRELTSLLARELESHISADQVKEGDLRPELRTARRIVRDEYASPITLPDVARRVGLSTSYLSRLFTSEIGRSFKEYLTEVRLDRAKELLQSSGLKVYEVAEAVGFPSYRYFSSLFKTTTGLRPKDFQTGQNDAV